MKKTSCNYTNLSLPLRKVECKLETTASKMAEGVLPFVRGLDLTKNDFKVWTSTYFILFINLLNPYSTVSVPFVEAGFSQAGSRHAKFTVVEIEPNWIGMSSRRVISPNEAGKSIDE